MPFVKLDCGILNSTLWFERECREVFITALLMAEPREFLEPIKQLETRSLEETGFVAPPGWYGFVEAAGVGILSRARVPDEKGFEALERLASPEAGSRSRDFDGRRMIRVDGGYVILNYMRYRDRDYTSAERSKRYRQRLASRRDTTPSHRDITQAEADSRDQKKIDQERKTAPRSTTSTPTILTFPTVGASPSWPLSQKHIESWGEAYPALDVLGECRRALAWVQAKPDRRKTAKGMPAFLVNWFNRSTDRGGHARSSEDVPLTKAQRSSQAIDQAFDSLERVHAARETERHRTAPQSLEVVIERPAGPRGR